MAWNRGYRKDIMGGIEITKKFKHNTKYSWLIYGTVLTVLILIFYAGQLSVPVISDETITMSNAAWTQGKDWSLMIAAIGGFYYRYIQALMTIPIFVCFKNDPAMIYKVSLILQAIIQASIVPVVYVICRRHLCIESEKKSVLLGMAACFVPAGVLYTYYFRGDYLLGVFPWYILLILLELIKAYDEKRSIRRMILSVLLAAFCIMSYMAHTRGIIVTFAVVMSVVFCRIVLKKGSLHWLVLFVTFFIGVAIDSVLTGSLKEALYSISGVSANSFEAVDMNAYFNIFSVQSLKEIIILCISWMYTLIVTNQGLVWLGICSVVTIIYRFVVKKNKDFFSNEVVVILFCFLIFAGYYAVGVLFFKGGYNPLLTGKNTRRVDRLLYDRYSICGAGMMIFLALYILCCRPEWIKWRTKLLTLLSSVFFGGFVVWKIIPLVKKYSGYIYNTIILNTYQNVDNPANILSGEFYEISALTKISLLGFALMIGILIISMFKKRQIPYLILGIVLISDIALIHVNFIKIRKASNDYVLEATQDIVQFMQELEDDITQEYPYILKGGLSGIKIQFYQSQLMDYKMFGKKQEEMLDLDNYFIISKQGDIDTKWYEEDYYLFEKFDYENAQYDIVYVKGEELMKKLESLGYEMYPYEMPADVQTE